MNDETKEALISSILKWKGIADGTEIDLGTKNCPLCKLFNRDDCAGCPIVSKLPEYQGCNGTPYEEWLNHISTKHTIYKGDKRVICEECKVIALKEVDFLESLIEEKEEGEFESFYATFNITSKEELMNLWCRISIEESEIRDKLDYSIPGNDLFCKEWDSLDKVRIKLGLSENC